MINAYTLGFIGIAALTGLGADYYNQSLLANKRPGAITAQDYMQSVMARLEGTRTSIAATTPVTKAATKAAATAPQPGAAPRALSDAQAASDTAPRTAAHSNTGAFEDRPEATATAPKPEVRRLQLSGGTTCLNGNGRLCD